MSAKKQTIDNYYGLVLLIEAVNTNPQGDPDQENRPRQLPDGRGHITAAGIKRKVRDFLSLNGENIYVARRACFATQDYKIAKQKKLPKPESLKKGYSQDDADAFVRVLADEYFDVRSFGQLVARLTTSMRGPVQWSEGISIDPVEINDVALTRCAVATENEAKSQEDSNKTMGNKSFVTYGLYRFDIMVNPHDAMKSGYTEEDHKTLINAILSMFQNDAASGRMLKVRAFHQFSMPRLTKDGKAAYAPIPHVLERVKVIKKCFDPKSFDDYEVDMKELDAAIAKGAVGHSDLLKGVNDTIFK